MSATVASLARELEVEYEHKPRTLLLLLVALSYMFILAQSYLALPRPAMMVFIDTWELLLFAVPLSLAIIWMKPRYSFALSVFYLALGISLAFARLPIFVKSEYATISSLMGIWFAGEWWNQRSFQKSVLAELRRGNYYLAAGLFLSTVVLGSVVELLNAPVRLWWYQWPFPSVEVLGLPVFLAAFGWFPWILAMFVFLYPFAVRNPESLGPRTGQGPKKR